MELIVNAVMLKAIDYGENEKILTLLTAENGKITAGIKGVKKSFGKTQICRTALLFCRIRFIAEGRQVHRYQCGRVRKFLRPAHWYRKILFRKFGGRGGRRAHLRRRRISRNFFRARQYTFKNQRRRWKVWAYFVFAFRAWKIGLRRKCRKLFGVRSFS